MLIRFSIENWMSYKDKATFSMLGSKERQHGARVSKISKYNAKVLPVCALYGGNASGKTNFFKALNFVQYMVVKGTLPQSQIPVKPFLLNPVYSRKPSSFAIEMLIDDSMYELSFSLTRKEVIEEKLVQINRTNEKVLYHRISGAKEFNSDVADIKKDERLNYVFQGTQPNLLFLTNSVNQQIERFRHIYDWFLHSLVLIAPDSRFNNYERFIDENDPLYDKMKEMLPLLDTGIVGLGNIEIPFDTLNIPEDMRNQLLEEIKDGMTVRLNVIGTNERYLISGKNGELKAKKLVSHHLDSEGKEHRFNLVLESDGTQRLIDVLPAFIELTNSSFERVFIIDELDRCLHTLLSKQLITSYLASCTENSRSQLLFTTHDVLLMDQSLLRRDEMWVAERDTDGSSTIYSLSDFKDIRYDKNIRNSYLLGRLGGIPRILLSSTCPERG